jgi:hypothetical protein
MGRAMTRAKECLDLELHLVAQLIRESETLDDDGFDCVRHQAALFPEPLPDCFPEDFSVALAAFFVPLSPLDDLLSDFPLPESVLDSEEVEELSPLESPPLLLSSFEPPLLP